MDGLINKDLFRNIGLILGLTGVATIALLLSLGNGIGLGLIVYVSPLLLCFFIVCLRSPFYTFLTLYVASFIVLGLSRYVEFFIPPGLIVDILILFNFVVILIQYLWGERKVESIYFNPVLVLSIGWMLYCILQIANPMTSFSNWSTSVRNIGMHIVADRKSVV